MDGHEQSQCKRLGSSDYASSIQYTMSVAKNERLSTFSNMRQSTAVNSIPGPLHCTGHITGKSTDDNSSNNVLCFQSPEPPSSVQAQCKNHASHFTESEIYVFKHISLCRREALVICWFQLSLSTNVVTLNSE